MSALNELQKLKFYGELRERLYVAKLKCNDPGHNEWRKTVSAAASYCKHNDEGHRVNVVFWICQFLQLILTSKFIQMLWIIAGNIATLCVLYTTDLGFRSSFTRLISNLCFYDTFCIVFNATMFTFPLLSETYRHQILPSLLPLFLPLAQISLTGSVYTIVAVALECFIAVKW